MIRKAVLCLVALLIVLSAGLQAQFARIYGGTGADAKTPGPPGNACSMRHSAPMRHAAKCALDMSCGGADIEAGNVAFRPSAEGKAEI